MHNRPVRPEPKRVNSTSATQSMRFVRVHSSRGIYSVSGNPGPQLGRRPAHPRCVGFNRSLSGAVQRAQAPKSAAAAPGDPSEHRAATIAVDIGADKAVVSNLTLACQHSCKP